MTPTNCCHVIVDADVLIYRAAAASEVETDWGNGLWTLHSFEAEAFANFLSEWREITDALENRYGFNIEKTTLALSDPFGNFRKELNPDYKANRKGKRKPVCYKALRDTVIQLAKDEGNDVIRYPKLEGDDVIGIIATRERELQPLVVSVDKDFNTIPCTFYNFGKDELIHISKGESIRYHAYQTLIGDTADGYKGCPSYGPVKAKRLLEKSAKSDGEIWQAVVDAFIEVGLTKEDALLQARMAYILQDGDYDPKTGNIKYWNFPSYVQ